MIFFILIFTIYHSFGLLDFLLIYSSQTQIVLIQKLEKSLKIDSKFDLSEKNLQSLANFVKNAKNPVLVDITENSEFFPLLDQISQIYGTIYFTLTYSSSTNFSKYRFLLKNTAENEKNYLYQMISYLSWQKFNIFYNAEPNQIEVASTVKSEFTSIVDSFVSLFQGVTDNSLNTIVKKAVKASGTRKLLLVGGGNDISRLQYFIKERKLELAGTHLLFSSEGIYSAYLNGSIILAYPGTELSSDENEMKASLIINILENLENENFDNYLNSVCPNNECVSYMSVVNIQSGEKIVVGTVSDSVNISIPIIYPGLTTSKLAFLSSTPLTVSIANGTSEPVANITYDLFAAIYKGSEYAVYRSNLYNDIPNFHIQLTPTDCGNNYNLDSTSYRQCFSKLKDKLGITYLTSFSSIGTLANYEALEYLNITIPQISPLSSIEDFNNKTKYPKLLKLGMSNFDYGESLLLFLLSFNWDYIIFFGSTEPAYHLQYLEYLEILESIGVNITNPENLRLFPDTLTRSDLKNFTNYFEFAKNSKCRIYLLWTPFSALILEALYDIGLRKEDVIVFSGISILTSMSEVVEAKYTKKRHEFLPGMNIFTYKEWIGELGELLYYEISSKITSDTTYLCMTYDAISVFKYSINHLLLLGEDYDSYDILIKSMRLQRLTGCMGTIFFLPDSNAVATFQVGLGNLYYNETSNNLYVSFYATSNKYDTQIIKYTRELQWPSGKSTPPTNFINFGTCDIDDRIVRKSQKGRNLLISISVVYFIISLFSAWFSSKFYFHDLKIIEKGKEPSLSDYSVILYMPLQLFQIIALGPNKLFSYFGVKVQKLLGMNWISLYNLEFFSFWKLLNMYLYFTYLYIFFVFITIKTKQKIFDKNYLLSRIKDLIDLLLPLIGHFLFIPIFSNLMSIFSCSNSIGDDLQDSYLDRDCKVYCYKSSHLSYSYASGIGILFYLIISIVNRPYWDAQQVCLSIQTKVEYYSVQSIFQVSIVLINSILSMHFDDYIGFAIAGIIVLYFIITQFMKPYNYPRGFLIQKVCLCIAFWCMFFESVFVYTERKKVLASIYLAGIVIIAGIGGLLLMKIEDDFKSPKKSDISRRLWTFIWLGSINFDEENDYIQSQQDETVLENKRQPSIGNIVTSQHAELIIK